MELSKALLSSCLSVPPPISAFQKLLLHVSLSSGYWKMYSIVIQLGAILVLPIYFRHHIAKLFSTFPEGEKKDCDYLTHPLSLVMIAFVVTAIPSFLLTKVIGKNLESLYVMGARSRSAASSCGSSTP